MTFVQIGKFDWLLGRQKGSIFVKIKDVNEYPHRYLNIRVGIQIIFEYSMEK